VVKASLSGNIRFGFAKTYTYKIQSTSKLMYNGNLKKKGIEREERGSIYDQVNTPTIVEGPGRARQI
jgi:hypothetical protein